MTTPPAPSVINPDIPLPPRPNTSTPSGDRPLSPTNTAGAPNKRSRIVSDDTMNVDTTSPSAPAPNLISTVRSGLPVNKVQVITSPPNTTTPVETVEASIHALSNNVGKGKAVTFDIPECRPSPMHDYTDCVSSPRVDLLNLAFTHYSPADAKLNDEANARTNTNNSPVAFLFAELYTMTTPPAPSVINPDILPSPRPDTSAPSGD
ncbi:hypothetical protein RhiirB3_453136 [Rhizophagus irregularis]|nr:hypothetical protein RhiirB3_453136 [Rhizophagus irregularis]